MPIQREGVSSEKMNDHSSTPPDYWIANDWKRETLTPIRGWGKHVVAVCEALFATHEGPPPRDRLHWVWTHIHDFSVQVGGLGVFAFRLSLFFLTWVAPLFVFSLPPLRRLPVAKRIVALERFERSPLGMLFYALKAMLCMMYFEHPDAAKEVRFDGSSYRDYRWVEPS